MPRFVLLEHDHPYLHWDLMLQVGESLWTWRLAGPPDGAGEGVAADRIADHRLVYLDYQGPVSGNRGNVRRYDQGVFTWIDREPDVRVRLQGDRLCGTLRLARGQAVYEPGA